MTELKERLCGMFSENFGVDIEQLRDGVSFDALGLDSLALIEFSIVLQREFAVQLADDELRPEFTIDETAKILAGKGVRV